MTKTEVQLLSKAQAVEIKAYAVAGTFKERVERCSKHTDYIRANRPVTMSQMHKGQKY